MSLVNSSALASGRAEIISTLAVLTDLIVFLKLLSDLFGLFIFFLSDWVVLIIVVVIFAPIEATVAAIFVPTGVKYDGVLK